MLSPLEPKLGPQVPLGHDARPMGEKFQPEQKQQLQWLMEAFPSVCSTLPGHTHVAYHHIIDTELGRKV